MPRSATPLSQQRQHTERAVGPRLLRTRGPALHGWGVAEYAGQVCAYAGPGGIRLDSAHRNVLTESESQQCVPLPIRLHASKVAIPIFMDMCARNQ
jgi:hypothetical protein